MAAASATSSPSNLHDGGPSSIRHRSHRCAEHLEKEDEPTIIVCPDAVLSASNGLYDFQKQSLAECAKLGDRVPLCIRNPTDETAAGKTFVDRVQEFRDSIGINNLKYGAAYTPWLFRPRFPDQRPLSGRSAWSRNPSSCSAASLSADQRQQHPVSSFRTLTNQTRGFNAKVRSPRRGHSPVPQVLRRARTRHSRRRIHWPPDRRAHRRLKAMLDLALRFSPA